LCLFIAAVLNCKLLPAQILAPFAVTFVMEPEKVLAVMVGTGEAAVTLIPASDP